LSGSSGNNVVNNNTLRGNLSAGIALFGSSSNKVYNNTITDMPMPNANNQMGAIVICYYYEDEYPQSIDNDITFNTIYNCTTPLVIYEPNVSVVSNSYNRITNNVFADYTNIYPAPDKPIAFLTNNGWFTDIISEGVDLLDTYPIRGTDAKLTSPNLGNYIPSKSSLLVGAATENFVTIDSRGIVRPQGATCDIGAYERLAYET
jgi:parallel beta-helix repeat protein